jgi:predicted DNA-binding ArsR family transcriptional regulator
MSTRKLIAVLLVLPLIAAAAHAQSYTLKIKGGPSAGKSVTVKENVKVNIAFSISLDNNVLMEEKKVVDEEKQYVEKLIASNDKGPTKFSRAYSKALKSVRKK